MDRIFYLSATLALTTYGQLIVKARSLALSAGARPGNYLLAMVTDLGFLSALVAALAASLCWTLAIQKTQLSVAYPFMALSFVLIPLGSVWLFGDRLSVGQLAGCFLIIAGVTISALAS
ncbi:EamA-like transporter family protein [Rhizobiales bacterium GAS113]|nr:EamA-like transporter family protein [Rhizobiales bacterium GAS113]